MKIFREETFGPVAPLVAFASDEEAIELANRTEFGLASCASTRATSAACLRVARALEYGMVGINTGLITTEVAPFGVSSNRASAAKARNTASTNTSRPSTCVSRGCDANGVGPVLGSDPTPIARFPAAALERMASRKRLGGSCDRFEHRDVVRRGRRDGHEAFGCGDDEADDDRLRQG